jgi:hypothetical protein
MAPGVEQRGAVAVASRSGAPLAISPGAWTDGCPRIRNFAAASDRVDITAYLDPANGDVLAVDVVPVGDPCSFASFPQRWIAAAAPVRQDVPSGRRAPQVAD